MIAAAFGSNKSVLISGIRRDAKPAIITVPSWETLQKDKIFRVSMKGKYYRFEAPKRYINFVRGGDVIIFRDTLYIII